MRNAFIDELLLSAELNNNLYLIVGDLGYGVIDSFQEKFPDKLINSGIAEQNMVGIAAGLASEGAKVFTYSIANFPVFRCAEQLRNDVDYHDLDVTTVAIGGGVAYGNLGYSHHAVQDYGFMRSLPNTLIFAPGDPFEVRACMSAINNSTGPKYLRLGKTGEQNFNMTIPNILEGELNIVKSRKVDNKKIILSTGASLSYANKLFEKSNASALISLPIWGEKVKNKIYSALLQYEEIVVVEDHMKFGGLYSFIRETGIDSTITSISFSNDLIGKVGSQNYLNKIGWNLVE